MIAVKVHTCILSWDLKTKCPDSFLAHFQLSSVELA
jgi:hypothetical protein